MNIPKLFQISSAISQEFWMFCVVKLNTVTRNTQICELQSTFESPSLDINSSGSKSVIPTLWRAFEPRVWFQASLTKVLKSHSNIWTNADNRIEERSKIVFPYWKAGYSMSPQLSVMLGQPAGTAAYAEFRTRASTQGRSEQGTDTETEVTRSKRDQRLLWAGKDWLWLI